MRQSKLTLGAYLVTAMLLLIVGTILCSGFFTWHQSREAVKVLAADSIEDNINLVDLRVQGLLKQTEQAAEEIERLLESNGLSASDSLTFERGSRLLGTLGDQLQSNQDLAYLSITLESTGEFLQVSRNKEGETLFQSNQLRAPTTYVRTDWVEPLGRRVEVMKDAQWKVDSRTRPYYLAARNAFEAGQALAWTEAYSFIPSGDQEQEFGVTCAMPIRSEKGEFLGVITADLTLSRLERFLDAMRIRDVGYGFVIESHEKATKSPTVLAVPRMEVKDSRSDVQTKEILRTFSKLSSRNQKSDLNLASSESLLAESGGETLVVGYRRVRWPGVDWTVFAVVPESAYLGALVQTYQTATRFAGVLALAGAALAFLLARRVALPLRDLTAQAKRIGDLDLSQAAPTQHSVQEVAELSLAMERMRNSLRSFERLVPKAYVRYLMHSNQEAVLSVEQRRLTLLFVDLEGFTTQASTEPLGVVVPMLNQFLQLVSEVVTEQEGTIDKYLGDEVMAFWGAPELSEHPEDKALVSGLAILERLPDGLNARVGIATGVVMVGNIGTKERLNYTAIGDRVNLASRLQGLNKVYGTCLLVDEETAQSLGPGFAVRQVDKVAVMGRSHSEVVSTVLAVGTGQEEHFTKWLELSNSAFRLYQEGRFADAERAYYDAILLDPEDSASAVMMERCQLYQRTPPGANWTGVYSPTSK